jgi:hypothetical protein
MKNFKSIALALVVVYLHFSPCTTKKITAGSTINWTGEKVTGQHEGTINIKDGALVFKEKKLVGGTFNVDMNS